MNPLVSIIIPTYNRAQIIGETLDSIIAQTYTNWECIVVDDGSTDNTQEVLEEYIDKDTRFKYHHRPKGKPKGPNSCRNYGFKICKGDYVNFFDSDDIYNPFAFEKIIRFDNDQIDAVIAETELIDIKTGRYISKNKIYSHQLIQDYFIGNITFFVGGPFWKKSFLDSQEQLFDEDIGNVDDWDFNLRMLYNKPKLIIKNEVLMQYRIHNDSFSKEPGKLNKKEIISDFRAREKHYNLVRSYENVNLKLIKKFILKRYNEHLNRALFQNNPIKFFLFKKIIIQEIKFLYIFSLIKTITGFTLYLFFKKGYVFLKS